MHKSCSACVQAISQQSLKNIFEHFLLSYAENLASSSLQDGATRCHYSKETTRHPTTHPHTGHLFLQLLDHTDLYEILLILYYRMNLSFNFHKDQRFCCRDICRTILAFFLILYFQCVVYIFKMWASKLPPNLKNAWNSLEFLAAQFKFFWKNTLLPAPSLYSSPSIELKLFFDHYESPCIDVKPLSLPGNFSEFSCSCSNKQEPA